MLDVAKIEDAEQIWLIIEKRFNHERMAPVIPEERKKYYTLQLSPQEAKNFDENLAKHPKYQEVKDKIAKLKATWKKPKLIEVNPNGNYPRPFSHLLGWKKKPDDNSITGLKVKILHDPQKSAELLKALKDGDWDAKILQPTTYTPTGDNREFKIGSKEYELNFLALSLYAAEKISRQQIYTILCYTQTVKEYSLQKIAKILDDKGEFTAEAKEKLLPVLNKRFHLTALTTIQINQLKLLILALPKSEQIFYMISKTPKKPLETALENLDFLLSDYTNWILLSTGAHEALALVRFGLSSFSPILLMLGQKSIQDIENAVVEGYRPGAVNFFGTVPYVDIHKIEDVSNFAATEHDRFHAWMMCLSININTGEKMQQNKGIRMALLKCINVMRNITKIKYTKENWILLDGEVHFLLQYFKDINFLDFSDKNLTELFCNSILYGVGDPEGSFLFINYAMKKFPKYKTSEELNSHQWELTTMGALILIHMANYREEWVKIGIDPHYLTPAFSVYYDNVLHIFDKIKGRDPKIQILKLQCYVILKAHHNAVAFSNLSKIIDQAASYFTDKLQFMTIKKRQLNAIAGNPQLKAYFPKNSTTLCCDGKELAPPSRIFESSDDSFMLFLTKILADLHCQIYPAATITEGMESALALLVRDDKASFADDDALETIELEKDKPLSLELLALRNSSLSFFKKDVPEKLPLPINETLETLLDETSNLAFR